MVGRAACGFAEETKSFAKTDPLASLVMGLPLGGVVAVLGLAPFAVAGSLAVRLARNAESMLGGLAMGTIGFLTGSLVSLWLAELAICWLMIEAILIVANAAAKVEARRQELLESQTPAAA